MSEMTQHKENPTTILPFDLLDIIVHNLDSQDDQSTLVACLYTSRTLHDLAQKQLFYTVAFSRTTFFKGRRIYQVCEDENSNTRISSLNRVFTKFPHFLDHVREVKFLFIHFSRNGTDAEPVITKMEGVPQILSEMKNLRRISFPGPGKNVSVGDYVSWESVPSSLKDFFLEFAKSKSCTSLDLRGIIDFPTRILSQLPSVRSLAWLTPRICARRDHNHSAGSRISLQSLELGTANEMRRRRRQQYESYWKQTLRWLEGPSCEISLENLRHLAMPIFSPREGVDVDDASQILAFCSTSLETLTFRTLHNVHQEHQLIGGDTTDDHYITQPPDLSGLHCLSSLSIYTSIAISDQPELFKNPIPWIMDLLKPLSRAPCFADHFRTLCLHLELQDFPQDLLGRTGLANVQNFLKEQSEGRSRKTLDIRFYTVDEGGLRERISLGPAVWERLFQ